MMRAAACTADGPVAAVPEHISANEYTLHGGNIRIAIALLHRILCLCAWFSVCSLTLYGGQDTPDTFTCPHLLNTIVWLLGEGGRQAAGQPTVAVPQWERSCSGAKE